MVPSVIFVMVNITYVSLAWAISVKLLSKILAWLTLNVAVALMPISIR